LGGIVSFGFYDKAGFGFSRTTGLGFYGALGVGSEIFFFGEAYLEITLL
jgi:hypothetical protein